MESFISSQDCGKHNPKDKGRVDYMIYKAGTKAHINLIPAVEFSEPISLAYLNNIMKEFEDDTRRFTMRSVAYCQKVRSSSILVGLYLLRCKDVKIVCHSDHSHKQHVVHSLIVSQDLFCVRAVVYFLLHRQEKV